MIEHATILCDSGADHAASTCRSGSTAADGAAAEGPHHRRRSRSATWKCRRSTRRSNATAATSPKAAEELGISLKTLYNKLNQTALLEKAA